uniref:28 kDa Metastriate family member n=1 Tax=Rhipicephalus zambeziensis TaxID=60191 RepID=A0A224Y9Z9_9ACAR
MVGLFITALFLFATTRVALAAPDTSATTANSGEKGRTLLSNKNRPPIGEGVKLYAYALYDASYRNTLMGEKDVPGASLPKSTPEVYFQELFRKLQEHLNNLSIMINVTVKQVAEIHNLTVLVQQKHMDGRHTLENLTRYGESRRTSTNSVHYLFTWVNDTKDINTKAMIDFISADGQHKLGVSEVSTEDTFCTTNVSAAVLRHKPTTYNYHSLAKATTSIFGSKTFIEISDKDWMAMNKTFLRCSAHQGDRPIGC